MYVVMVETDDRNDNENCDCFPIGAYSEIGEAIERIKTFNPFEYLPEEEAKTLEVQRDLMFKPEETPFKEWRVGNFYPVIATSSFRQIDYEFVTYDSDDYPVHWDERRDIIYIVSV